MANPNTKFQPAGYGKPVMISEFFLDEIDFSDPNGIDHLLPAKHGQDACSQADDKIHEKSKVSKDLP